MIEIVKYPNRRLYGPRPDTNRPGYLTLGDVREFVEQGVKVRIRLKKNNRDVTSQELLQILKDVEEVKPRMTQEQICNLICAQ